MTDSKLFLFHRISYYKNLFAKKDKSVTKGDEEEKLLTSEAITQIINICDRRARCYRIIFIIVVFLAALTDPITTILEEYYSRLIICSLSSIIILVANLLAWPQYAEKLNSIVDTLEDIKDGIDSGEELSTREKQRLKRIIEMAHLPHIFSDKVRPLSTRHSKKNKNSGSFV